MQDANQVVAVMQHIAAFDFATGLYLNTTSTKGNQQWIGYAAHGRHRRYFEVMVDGMDRPVVRLISRAESDKSIERVHPGLGDEFVAVDELVKGGHPGVLRGLGLYRALAERGSLKLSDFKLSAWSQGKYPSGHFAALACWSDSLESVAALFSGGVHTREVANATAKDYWDNDEDGSIGVLVDHQGNALAAYYRGKQIA